VACRPVLGTIGEQQLQITIARGDGSTELVDRGTGEQIAAQALEHRPQKGVRKGKSPILGIRISACAADYRHHPEQLLRILTNPAHVCGELAAQCLREAWSLRVAARGLERIFDEAVEIRSGRGLAGPANSALGVEQ